MPFQRGGDNLVVLVILGILVYIGVSGFRSAKAQKAAVDCLLRRTASTDAAPCPHAEAHLPALAGVGGGALAIPEWTQWAKVEATPAGVVVTRVPRFWWRYLAGPLLQLIGLGALVLLGSNIVIEMGRKPRQRGLLITYAVVAILLGFVTWSVIRSGWARETWTFDAAARTVKRQDYLGGMAWGGPTVHAEIKALAPVRGSRTALVLVGKDGLPVELFALQPEALGALTPLVNSDAARPR